jgi:hypothetical protein
MLSSLNYVIRSQQDGKYLVARVATNEDVPETSYLLLFKTDYEALSYINTHGQDVRDRLTIESLSSIQLKSLLQRWGYQGIGLVEDALIPNISFLEI